MSTKPEDDLLALWVEDELDLAVHTEVEVWASAQAEWVERRDLARASQSLLGEVLSPDEDLPNAEFFNARIRREIEVSASPADPVEVARPRHNPMVWLVPLTAAASLVLGIWIGRGAMDPNLVPAPIAELAPVLYTPQKGVEAELLKSDEATVIVLAGVDAIPDSWEVPATAMREPEPRPMASTEE